jgi:hypothetical protein
MLQMKNFSDWLRDLFLNYVPKPGFNQIAISFRKTVSGFFKPINCCQEREFFLG